MVEELAYGFGEDDLTDGEVREDLVEGVLW